MRTQGRPRSNAGPGAAGGEGQRRTLADYLEQNKNVLEEACGRFMRADDLIRIALKAASYNPDIAKCSPRSMLRALMEAGELQIRPMLHGRGHIVPRSNKRTGELEACFDPGYKGLIELALRGGEVLSIEARAVFQHDTFKVRFGTTTEINHEPALSARGNVVAAYALAHLRNGSLQLEVLTQEDLEKIRRMSARKSAGGPWDEWFEEMARKSAVRRLAKYLPFNADLEHGLEAAASADGLLDTDGITVEERPELPEAGRRVPDLDAVPAADPVPVEVPRSNGDTSQRQQ